MQSYYVALCSILAVTLFSGVAFPQDTLWTRHYGGPQDEWAQSVTVAPDGGFVMAGSTCSYGAGGADIWLIKIDNNGDTVWTKTYGGTDWDYGESIATTSDGGYVIGGNTRSFDHGEGDDIDFWLLRTDCNGDTLWTRVYGQAHDYEIATSVCQTSDGGFFLTGRHSPDYLPTAVLVLKTDSLGNLQWSGSFTSPDGLEYRIGYSGIQTADGGYVVCGASYNLVYRFSDILLMRLSANGDSLWAYEYGDLSDQDEGMQVLESPDGGYVIAGRSERVQNHIRDKEGVLMKTDPEGTELWRKYFNRSGRDGFNAICLSPDGGYALTGYSEGEGLANFLVATADAAGNFVTSRVFGGFRYTERGFSIATTPDGGSIAVGFAYPDDGLFSDFYVVRLSSVVSAEPETGRSFAGASFDAYPNPFNDVTTISFQLEQSTNVDLTVYNIVGQQVRKLISGTLPSGNHLAAWDSKAENGAVACSGVYFCRLVTPVSTQTRRVLLLR